MTTPKEHEQIIEKVKDAFSRENYTNPEIKDSQPMLNEPQVRFRVEGKVLREHTSVLLENNLVIYAVTDPSNEGEKYVFIGDLSNELENAKGDGE